MKITPWESQKTVAIFFPTDMIVFTFFGTRCAGKVHCSDYSLVSGLYQWTHVVTTVTTTVVDQQLGSSLDKGDYYQIKGTILLLRRENCLYKACPKDGCNKKVVDNDNGTYTCEKCGKIYEKFRFRLLCNESSLKYET
ncbi:hypothetical protein HUJ04_011256 [Dendroctonus ponderosae]|nr:hypothetical protein HUJ04_011256 [Dendroctonus ponderosae]